MGVTTTADEKIRNARELISQAQKEIVTVLDPDTWGHNEYSEERIEELHIISLELLKIKRKI